MAGRFATIPDYDTQKHLEILRTVYTYNIGTSNCGVLHSWKERIIVWAPGLDVYIYLLLRSFTPPSVYPSLLIVNC